MVLQISDPVRQLEHSHERLTKLTWEIRELLRAWAREAGPDAVSGTARAMLALRIEALKGALLEHFADEEEGLFPFLRSHVPAKAEAVARLEADHDALCGAVIRLARLASHGEPARGRTAQPSSNLADHYERFETTYALHSRHEAALFRELESALGSTERAELARILAGL
jgi:hypothetical protein